MMRTSHMSQSPILRTFITNIYFKIKTKIKFFIFNSIFHDSLENYNTYRKSVDCLKAKNFASLHFYGCISDS